MTLPITPKMRKAFKEAALVACPYAPEATRIDELICAVLDAIEVDEEMRFAAMRGYTASMNAHPFHQGKAFAAALTAALRGDQ